MSADDRGLEERAAQRRSRAVEEAARALLPVLLHRIKNTTQLIVGVDSLFGGADASRFSRDLSSAATDVSELGWWLGVLATGLGADTLVERVERRGLESLLVWARAAARRAGRDIELGAALPPSIALDPRAGQRLAWTILALFALSAISLDEGATLRWRIDRVGGVWRLTIDAPLSADAHDLIEGFAHASLERSERDFTWTLPGEWLAERAT
jgi:hypothetical protein